MKPQQVMKLCPLVALMVIGTNFGVYEAIAAPPVQEGVNVLTRGPVHEAFAEVIAFDRQAAIVAPKAPPDAIEELPPEQKPAGANVAWIPGYWAWDDDAQDFLWVSGVWRFLPPGRQWVAGYWGKSDGGYQWTSGYWADGKAREIEYLSQPPEMVNAEPDGDAPSENQNWIPGVPVWNENRYAMRPGYWATMQPDWEWIPAHYVATPRGYVFVDGYWDYSVSRRGVLFAPVMFDAGVYSQPGFSYSPFYAINTAALIGNLFLRPSYGHYYFGDYYAANYEGLGFFPSYAYHNHQGYDPFYAQQRWLNRQNRDWQQNVETQFRNRRDNEEARPPRTLAAQTELAKGGKSTDGSFVVAAPLGQFTGSKDKPLRFEPVTGPERLKLGQSGKEIENHRVERQKLESGAAAAPAKVTSGASAPAKVKLPSSPIVAKAPDQLGAGQAPPKIHEAPRPDLNAEPKSAAKVEGKPIPKVTTKPTRKEDPAVVPKDEPKAEPKRQPIPGARVEPKRDSKPASNAEPIPESKPEPKPTPKAESKPERKPTPKPEPKPVPKDEPKAEPKPQPKPVPKAEPKPESKPEPKPAPRAEPKPEPKPVPRAEPKSEPKPQPKPEPKPETKPAPKVEPKAAPKA